jgi:hypothetical protein
MSREALIQLYVEKYLTGNYQGDILEEIEAIGIYEDVLEKVYENVLTLNQ